MNQEFDWDNYIDGQVEGAKAATLERVIAHVLSLDEGSLRSQGLQAIKRASKIICDTPTATRLMVKYAPGARQG